MYNHTRQYRCTIIRGKSQNEIDNFLPAYAKIINDICPCPKDSFEMRFNEALNEYIPRGSKKKTFDNHRTEIAGKLFGMYYTSQRDGDDSNSYVYASERTMKFLEDNDQPAFFKDVCYKMQFPNGMTKPDVLKERIDLNINIRPNSYVLKVLSIAKIAGLVLTKKDIGYYVLNSLDVLQLKASAFEVIDQIEHDRKNGIVQKVHTDGKAASFDLQHINEQINYLELANLIITNNEGEIFLNENENAAIDLFAELWNEKPVFDVYSYNLGTVENRKRFQYDWDFYYSKLSDKSDQFVTTSDALGIPDDKLLHKQKGPNLIEIGDEGEQYVFEFEKQRVRAFDKRLAGKVVHLGKTKGLGYDLQSVIAEAGNMAEFVKYIEVKSTKRVTEPDINDGMWIDTLNITRNEWVAAQQHKSFYSIYRVYFIRGNIIMYIIKDLYKKQEDGVIKIVPMTYRVDFGNSAVDEVINGYAKEEHDV